VAAGGALKAEELLVALELHMHPLSSYSWKVLIALYEAGTEFAPITQDVHEPAARAEFLKLSPFGKIPALRDTGRNADVFETSVIIEYLDQRYPGPEPLIPRDPEIALEARLLDRVFDLHVQETSQKIIHDRLRPESRRDPVGVEQAREQLRHGYAVLERRLAGRAWAAGAGFSLADCAAAPALFYADLVEPIGNAFPVTSAYLGRLLARPSVARAITGAKAVFHLFPATEAERARLAKVS
jgi:glutathione S-transferase